MTTTTTQAPKKLTFNERYRRYVVLPPIVEYGVPLPAEVRRELAALRRELEKNQEANRAKIREVVLREGPESEYYVGLARLDQEAPLERVWVLGPKALGSSRWTARISDLHRDMTLAEAEGRPYEFPAESINPALVHTRLASV